MLNGGKTVVALIPSEGYDAEDVSSSLSHSDDAPDHLRKLMSLPAKSRTHGS